MQSQQEHDVRLKWPFRLLLAGCSGCGKSTLMAEIAVSGIEVMTRKPSMILVYHAHGQGAYEKMAREAGCPVRLIKGGPKQDLVTRPGTLLIVDDLQASHADVVREWFTRKSHHFDTSIAYLVQNVFDKSPHHRTISLNCTYMTLFKNPRDASQVEHLSRQVFPTAPKHLTAAYRDTVSRGPHSYLVMDFNQDTPDDFRIRNTLFPVRDFPQAYAYVGKQH